MNAKTKQLMAIGLIIFALYNILVFSIGGFIFHEAPFWISYVFVLIAFAVAVISVVGLGQSAVVLRDWLFGYPILRHCAIYLVLEVIVSVVFMLLEYQVGWVLPFVIQILLLGIYGVLVLTCFISKSSIDQVHQKVQKKTQYIALLQAEAQTLCAKCSDPAVQAQCQKLAEAIRFSDPMSNDLLSALEQQLSATVAACSTALDMGNYELAGNLCEKAMVQLAERNAKCKALK